MMKTLISVSAAVSFLVVTPVAFMFFDQMPPYVYDGENSYVVPTKTEAGRQMTVHWRLKKINRVCIGSITRYVVDQKTTVRYSYDPTPAARTAEIDDMTLSRTFFLPPDVTPGRKWYYADAEFACNPLQRLYPLRVRTPRLSFEVLE
jgi:hypothetical protein